MPAPLGKTCLRLPASMSCHEWPSPSRQPLDAGNAHSSSFASPSPQDKAMPSTIHPFLSQTANTVLLVVYRAARCRHPLFSETSLAEQSTSGGVSGGGVIEGLSSGGVSYLPRHVVVQRTRRHSWPVWAYRSSHEFPWRLVSAYSHARQAFTGNTRKRTVFGGSASPPVLSVGYEHLRQTVSCARPDRPTIMFRVSGPRPCGGIDGRRAARVIRRKCGREDRSTGASMRRPTTSTR